jgi:hypothetical protein
MTAAYGGQEPPDDEHDGDDRRACRKLGESRRQSLVGAGERHYERVTSSS